MPQFLCLSRNKHTCTQILQGSWCAPAVIVMRASECTRNLNDRPVGLLVFGSMGPAAQRKTRTKKIFQCAAPLHLRAAELSGDFHSSSAMNTGCECALRETGDARGWKCCPKTTPMESTRFKDYTHRRIACVVPARGVTVCSFIG